MIYASDSFYSFMVRLLNAVGLLAGWEYVWAEVTQVLSLLINYLRSLADGGLFHLALLLIDTPMV